MARSSPKRREISRRALLAAIGINVIDSVVHIDHEAREKAPSPGFRFASPVRAGKSKVTPLLTEHDAAAWRDHGSEVCDAITQFDVVIPEYFPPEYEHLRNDPRIGGMVRWNDVPNNVLFHGVAETLANRRMNTWVVDPAYGLDLVALRYILTSAVSSPVFLASATNLAFGYGRTHLKPNTDSINSNRASPLERRAFLRVAAATAGATSLVFFDDHSLGSEEKIEIMFRQAVVAGHLKELCNSGAISSDDNAVAIFPEGHWLPGPQKYGIARLFADDPLRNNILKAFEKLFGQPLEGLFQARHYPDGVYIPNRETVRLTTADTAREFSRSSNR